jgi:nucleoside-diphosphate-sugar epimerase
MTGEFVVGLSARTFPRKAGAIGNDVTVEFAIEITGPDVTEGAFDETCGKTAHKKKIDFIGGVAVIFSGVHGFLADETFDISFSTASFFCQLEVFIRTMHTNSKVGIARFGRPSVTTRAFETYGSGRYNHHIVTYTTFLVEGNRGRGGRRIQVVCGDGGGWYWFLHS